MSSIDHSRVQLETLTGRHSAPGGIAFHHIGVACVDIEEECKHLLPLGYVVEGDDFVDPVQGIRGRFLGGQGPRLELLAPLPGSGVLGPWLKKKMKLYHLGYTVKNMEATIEAMTDAGAKLVVAPVPAAGFDGRDIAFLMLPTLLLVELVAIDVTSSVRAITPNVRN